MTTAPIPAANAPAAPRSFGPLATLLRRWLGIADQRQDFDALSQTLHVKDQISDGQRRDLDTAARTIQSLAQQLHHWSGLFSSLQDRLHWYEARVPGILGAKKAYDAAIAREKARRTSLIAAHPEWNDATKQHVLQHGLTPGEATSGNGHGAGAPNLIEVVQRMPETPDDLADPSRLRLLPEGDGLDLDDDGT